MKIPLTLKPLAPASQTQASALLQQLRPGQLLHATVIALARANVVKLQIAATQVLARTPVPLEPGTKLQLEVTRTKPQALLRILREPTSAAPAQRERAVRYAMPRQVSPSETRQAVAALRANAATPKQAELVERVAAILRDAAIKPGQLSSAGVQRALNASGLFLEAALAQGTPPVVPDLKLGLLKLLRSLNTKTPAADSDADANRQQARDAGQSKGPLNDNFLQRLVRLVEGAVARIQLHQAVSLPAEESARQAWQIDLPVHTGDGDDDVRLRIERDDVQEANDGGTGWAVNLVFEFDSIGKLQCRIGLNGDRVATSFWCANQATHARLENRLPSLEQALQAQGLEVVHLSGRIGEPGDELIRAALPASLLDERA